MSDPTWRRPEGSAWPPVHGEDDSTSHPRAARGDDRTDELPAVPPRSDRLWPGPGGDARPWDEPPADRRGFETRRPPRREPRFQAPDMDPSMQPESPFDSADSVLRRRGVPPEGFVSDHRSARGAQSRQPPPREGYAGRDFRSAAPPPPSQPPPTPPPTRSEWDSRGPATSPPDYERSPWPSAPPDRGDRETSRDRRQAEASRSAPSPQDRNFWGAPPQSWRSERPAPPEWDERERRQAPPSPEPEHNAQHSAPPPESGGENFPPLDQAAAERTEPEPPVDDHTMPPPNPSRWAAAAAAAFAAALGVGIVAASMFDSWIYAAGIFGLQALAVAMYVWHRRPAGALTVAAVGVITAAAATLVTVLPQPFQPDLLVFVLAGAFVLAVAGQITRPGARERLTSSLGSSLFVAALVCGFAAWIALLRHGGGPQALEISVAAIVGGVAAARCSDLALPAPRINRQVTRGAFGVVIGGMVGTAAAMYTAVVLEGPVVAEAAMAGFVIGLVAVLADASAGFAQAGRRIGGDGVSPWPARHSLGPLLAFGVSGPVVYLLSVYFIVRGF